MKDGKRISWLRLKKNGILNIINHILLLFGIKIVIQTSRDENNDIVTDVYPCIVDWKRYTIYSESELKNRAITEQSSVKK